MPKLTIVTAGAKIDIEDDACETVMDVLRLYRDVLNIPANATPVVNGTTATPETRLNDGDEVAVNKPTGTKG